MEKVEEETPKDSIKEESKQEGEGEEEEEEEEEKKGPTPEELRRDWCFHSVCV